jgi:hypothetical protein
MWQRAFPRYPKSVRTVVVERCDVNFTPTRIEHYARVSLQLEACDNDPVRDQRRVRGNGR